MTRVSRRTISILVAAICIVHLAESGSAAPVADRHQIKWFVHAGLLTPSNDLAYYENLLDDALEDTQTIIEGVQGPADIACCQKLDKRPHSSGVSLQIFGNPGDGLDVINVGSDWAYLFGIGGSGSRGFIVDSIAEYFPLGLYTQGVCDSTYDDDPNAFMVVTLDSYEAGLLPLSIAHARGHNACLQHVSTPGCSIMHPSTAAGGCMTASECASFGAARQSRFGTCECQAGTFPGTPVADGTMCSSTGQVGWCSGGECGANGDDATVQLVSAGGPGAPSGQIADDALVVSALTGGWVDVGDLGVTIKGLAYDSSSSVLYGIADSTGDDRIVTIDLRTWSISTNRRITGRANVTGLTFDPGPTASATDNRLLALLNHSGHQDLIKIDPTTWNSTVAGYLADNIGQFSDLAYDSTGDTLFVSGSYLVEIDELSCRSHNSPCVATTVLTNADLSIITSKLAYSSETNALYLAGDGNYFLNPRTVYRTIDATSREIKFSISVDSYTAGGLAALPVPEPWSGPGVLVVALFAFGRGPRPRSQSGERVTN
ncbi:MAG: hypothetical protein IPK00_27585 [Deltaproteobacteria bacterium]|nr:hypothetical protein [Deltaproteobacteria bacterium]